MHPEQVLGDATRTENFQVNTVPVRYIYIYYITFSIVNAIEGIRFLSIFVNEVQVLKYVITEEFVRRTVFLLLAQNSIRDKPKDNQVSDRNQLIDVRYGSHLIERYECSADRILVKHLRSAYSYFKKLFQHQGKLQKL